MANIESKTPKRLDHLTNPREGITGKWKQEKALKELGHDFGLSSTLIKAIFSSDAPTELKKVDGKKPSHHSSARYAHTESELSKAAHKLEAKSDKLSGQRRQLEQTGPKSDSPADVKAFESAVQSLTTANVGLLKALGHVENELASRSAKDKSTQSTFVKKGPNQERDKLMKDRGPINALHKATTAPLGRLGGRFVASNKHYTGVAGNSVAKAASKTAEYTERKLDQAGDALDSAAQWVGEKVRAGVKNTGKAINTVKEKGDRAAQRLSDGVGRAGSALDAGVAKVKDKGDRAAQRVSDGVGRAGHAGDARLRSVGEIKLPRFGRSVRYDDFRAAYRAFAGGNQSQNPSQEEVRDFFKEVMLPKMGKQPGDYDKKGWDGSAMQTQLRHMTNQANSSSLQRQNAMGRDSQALITDFLAPGQAASPRAGSARPSLERPAMSAERLSRAGSTASPKTPRRGGSGSDNG